MTTKEYNKYIDDVNEIFHKKIELETLRSSKEIDYQLKLRKHMHDMSDIILISGIYALDISKQDQWILDLIKINNIVCKLDPQSDRDSILKNPIYLKMDSTAINITQISFGHNGYVDTEMPVGIFFNLKTLESFLESYVMTKQKEAQ